VGKTGNSSVLKINSEKLPFYYQLFITHFPMGAFVTPTQLQ
jgi:hypothetical protein